jgi:hypothetical protein
MRAAFHVDQAKHRPLVSASALDHLSVADRNLGGNRGLARLCNSELRLSARTELAFKPTLSDHTGDGTFSCGMERCLRHPAAIFDRLQGSSARDIAECQIRVAALLSVRL